MKNLIKENQQLFLDDAIKNINLLIQENKKEEKKEKEKKEIKYFDNIVEPVIAKEQNEKKVKVEKKFNYKMLSIIFGIIILILIIVIIIILTVPKNSESESPLISDNKGIQFEYEGSLDYGEFNSKKLSFILLKGGESTKDQFQKFKTNLEKAKDKNIKIGAYWLIKSEDEIEAINEADTAYNFLVQLENDGKLSDLNYDFYLKLDMNNKLLDDYNQVEKLCEKIKGKKSCGLALSSSKYEYYKSNIDNIKNINSYWIDSGNFDDKNNKKVAFINTSEKISISNFEFSIIKAN